MTASLDIDWNLLGDAPLAVAVSGGADSFALLHACTERDLPVVALTVDHGLREGSGEDARVVAAWCEARGVPHETLAWKGEKPTTGVQAAARTARYKLLCEACERLGLDRLATGHTLDDQAETVFMRLRRGAGRGLAGMPPSRKIASGPGEPVALLRPMLGVRRAATRAYAEAAGLPVRDDPSNEDEGFERVRVRALLAALEQQDLLTAEALGRVGRKALISERRNLEIVEAAAGRGFAYLLYAPETIDAPHTDGAVTVNWEDWQSAIGMEFISAVVGALGNHHALQDHVAFPARGSCVVVNGVSIARPKRGIELVLHREPAALLGRADGTPGLAPVPAPPASKHLYDRRFVVTVPPDVPSGTELRPLGQLLPRDVATSTLVRSRVCTLPCLSLGERVTHLPAAAIRAVWGALDGWKGREACLPSEDQSFEARSLLAERFANEVIRY